MELKRRKQLNLRPKEKIIFERPMFPFIYNDKKYEQKDCDESFLAYYEGWFNLSPIGCYVGDSMYIEPDGNIING